MKPVTMFVTSWCPYCKQAYSMMKKLKNDNPEYAAIEVKIIDEELHPEIAKQYDYYYVPTYFVNEVKIHEGVPSIEIIRNVFNEALK
ncbi:glutaredoxin family protein [Clostridium psychrophilum]|uniref:glutaredoxin family protein n=1 Tax=Clostridium psychrophilum TaxID=132926 RepID=UPI001C0D0D00|nr:thioredoxin family protein [Clostridium psychrophilum]MBU3179942.1 thioredoxin family protein [Clostridium psychrophilum]